MITNILVEDMIVGIESSCDESAIAVFDRVQGVMFNEIYSQINLHSEYGGVVPELAVREHVKNFCPLLECFAEYFSKGDIDSIAVTVEPGLPGCLAIGHVVANSLSVIWKKPIFKINHLHGHIFSPFISLHKIYGSKFLDIFQTFLPHLSLLVSGGNTLLQVINPDGTVVLLAETQDDAAGEAFDKGAKLLGLLYPGGHLIEKFAKQGNPKRYHFPRAYYDSNELKFSFSGLKTSLRYFLEKESNDDFDRDRNDICASYQEAIIDALVRKVEQCITFNIKSIGVCGGVSNNQILCNRLQILADKFELPFFSPEKVYTGDNAAMIAFAAYIDEIFSKFIK